MLELNILSVNMISDKIVSNIDMLGFLRKSRVYS
jgi:hypothetical protein